ncbi:MAG: SDR family NAD(P)-dependent oxidoreductase [Chthoniobacterales bacterium]|nr:SDR family NAD(P)-dependent oxidoreductase [Chthoniobacterales bacterium]
MNEETTLVTGASSGSGLHLAHGFARHGHPLVIVAPVRSELETAAEEFRSKHGVEVRVIAKDLEQENSAQEIFDELQAAGVEIDILVNRCLRQLPARPNLRQRHLHGFRAGACAETHRHAHRHLERREIKFDDIISPWLPLKEAPHAYKIFNDKKDDCVKVVLKP